MSKAEASNPQQLMQQLTAFMDAWVYPNEQRYREELERPGQRWRVPPVMQELKSRARAAGLWNLFLPGEEHGAGLSNREYAPMAEIMGRVPWASEVFNCNAPDTGNMEVLERYASDAQKAKWLVPLLNGEIRSCYAMTEPDLASSDATNVATSIRRDGDEYVVDGRKWFITGAPYELCRIMILMGKTDPHNPNRHLQQSQILIPMDTPGVTVVRPLTTLGYDDAPLGHAEILLQNVRVPATNLILGEGRGFEIAQGRLGPGRIHHCMRLIGCAQRALELACRRANSRMAFGRKLAEQGSLRELVALSAAELEQARLLTLHAAERMDRDGNKVARDIIGMAKIIVPTMAQNVIDRAIQIHGAGGLSQDYFLAEAFNYARYCRIVDGPDAVHMAALGKSVLAQYAS